MEARTIRHRYDHRFREFVHETGDIELAVRNGVPRSTARDWSRLSSPKVVTLDVASMSEHELRQEVIDLRERHARLLAILFEAGKNAVSTGKTPTLLADGGNENKGERIDELIESGILRRVLAQTEIACSNSMIESWWRQLKHQWLFLNRLDSVDRVRCLVEFYVEEHNSRFPHSAFGGQTPDEMYLGTGEDVPGDLEARRKEARARRLAVNRARSCRVCEDAGAE